MVNTFIEKARSFLRSRRMAYIRTFDGPVAEEVLADLAKYCRAHQSTAHPNRDLALQLEGRRQVWLRIQAHLKLTDEQVWQLFGEGKG